jgi:hypothetical protein
VDVGRGDRCGRSSRQCAQFTGAFSWRLGIEFFQWLLGMLLFQWLLGMFLIFRRLGLAPCLLFFLGLKLQQRLLGMFFLFRRLLGIRQLQLQRLLGIQQ